MNFCFEVMDFVVWIVADFYLFVYIVVVCR